MDGPVEKCEPVSTLSGVLNSGHSEFIAPVSCVAAAKIELTDFDSPSILIQ